MRKIRNKVFETNSSSCHSISLCKINENTIIDSSLSLNDNGVLSLESTDFGWTYETYTDAYTKAVYAYMDIEDNCPENLDFLKEVLKVRTKATEISWTRHKFDGIDHQSSGTAVEILKDLDDFIFNRASVLTIDNDNH